MTPKEIMAVLRRHVLLLILLTVLGTATGTGLCIVLRMFWPRYTTVGAIEILEPTRDDPIVITEGRVNPDTYDQFRNSKLQMMKRPGMLEELLRRDEVRQTGWFAGFVDGGNTNIAKAVKNLERNLRVTAPREVQLLTVSMTTGSRKESALIVNQMLDLFVNQQRAAATKDISTQLSDRKKLQATVKSELQITTDVMNQIRAGSPYGNLSETSFRDWLTDTLGSQETQLSRIENETTRLNSLVGILDNRARGAFDDVVTEQIEQDPVARAMRSSIAALEPTLAELTARFGENHRRVIEVRDALKQRQQDYDRRKAEIADIFRKANAQNANDQLIAVKAELETQKAKLETLRENHRDMSRTRARYLEATIERDEKQVLLESINTHIKKLQAIYDDPDISKVKKAWDAPEPLEISAPRLVFYVPGGFILGLLAGLLIAFAIEKLNDLVRTPSDVMKYLRVPLLGMICHTDEDDDLKGVRPEHVVRQAPYSIMSECYRQFRANLKLSGGNQDRKVILITSTAAADGKTSVAANLASTLVADNKKVLLVDANFRRPMVASLFPRIDEGLDSPSEFGLSNYLAGQCTIDEGLVRRTSVEDLDVIDSGPLPGNPAEALASNAMNSLVKKLTESYDCIIIDGPPLLVSDAKTLAAQTDGTILVLNADATRRGAAQRALRELRDIDANVLGSVLMGVKALKGGYFHEIYRSYQEYQKSPVAQPVA
jgi:capsular exopolysaccharide synthesis family protein